MAKSTMSYDDNVFINCPFDKVRSWLNAKSGRTTIPGGKAIWDHYVLFQKELTPMLKRAGITRAELEAPEYFPDYVTFVVEWLTEQEAKATRKKR